MPTLLEARAKEWEAQWFREGHEQGVAEGRAEGSPKGEPRGSPKGEPGCCEDRSSASSGDRRASGYPRSSSASATRTSLRGSGSGSSTARALRPCSRAWNGCQTAGAGSPTRECPSETLQVAEAAIEATMPLGSIRRPSLSPMRLQEAARDRERTLNDESDRHPHRRKVGVTGRGRPEAARSAPPGMRSLDAIPVTGRAHAALRSLAPRPRYAECRSRRRRPTSVPVSVSHRLLPVERLLAPSAEIYRAVGARARDPLVVRRDRPRAPSPRFDFGCHLSQRPTRSPMTHRPGASWRQPETSGSRPSPGHESAVDALRRARALPFS